MAPDTVARDGASSPLQSKRSFSFRFFFISRFRFFPFRILPFSLRFRSDGLLRFCFRFR